MTIIDSKTRAARDQAVKARDDLAATLDAIEDKLNVPKRVGELSERAVAVYRRNPVPIVVAGASVAAVAIGLIAWAIFRER